MRIFCRFVSQLSLVSQKSPLAHEHFYEARASWINGADALSAQIHVATATAEFARFIDNQSLLAEAGFSAP